MCDRRFASSYTFARRVQYCLAKQSLSCGEHIGMTFSWSIKPVKRLIPGRERKPKEQVWDSVLQVSNTAKKLDPKDSCFQPPIYFSKSQSTYSSCLDAVYLKETASWKHQLIHGLQPETIHHTKPHSEAFIQCNTYRWSSAAQPIHVSTTSQSNLELLAHTQDRFAFITSTPVSQLLFKYWKSEFVRQT